MKDAVPTLLFGQDDAALGPDGTWLSALYRLASAKASVPGLRAELQRAHRLEQPPPHRIRQKAFDALAQAGICDAGIVAEDIDQLGWRGL
jgi:hypothetical protein